jgi:hypothetical protein
MANGEDIESKQFHRMQRLPRYVFSMVVSQMMEERRKGEDVVDLGMGNPDVPTPEPIVLKMKEALDNPKNHRYSASRGIKGIRKAVCDWYQRRYEVELDPETEAIATIGAKEGFAHLALVTLGPGDVVFAPNPCYPIHSYACVIAGADVRSIPLTDEYDFFDQLKTAARLTWPLPKMIILNFPHNPTTRVVDLDFFQKVVEFAREKKIWLVHDLAYADLVYDGYRAPSLLEVPGEPARGPGRQGGRRRVLLHDQGLLHARVARGFLCGKPHPDRRPGQNQELPGLRHLPANTDRRHQGPQRVRRRAAEDRRDLPLPARLPGGGAQPPGLGDRQAQGHHVRVGQDPRQVQRHGQPRFQP